jgi:hypothetical protein
VLRLAARLAAECDARRVSSRVVWARGSQALACHALRQSTPAMQCVMLHVYAGTNLQAK